MDGITVSAGAVLDGIMDSDGTMVLAGITVLSGVAHGAGTMVLVYGAEVLGDGITVSDGMLVSVFITVLVGAGTMVSMATDSITVFLEETSLGVMLTKTLGELQEVAVSITPLEEEQLIQVGLNFLEILEEVELLTIVIIQDYDLLALDQLETPQEVQRHAGHHHMEEHPEQLDLMEQ